MAASRREAQEAIAAGRVTVDGAPGTKPATQVDPSQALVLSGPPPRFVSRGGEKLRAALERFDVGTHGRWCLDAGASTGGFTDCLLQAGAAHVVAVDVGYGQIAERLRTDPRVTVLERTNVRELRPADVPGEAPELVVADLSFISLRLVLPPLREVAAPEAEAVVLVKPQFEAGRAHVGKGGVVRDPAVWAATLLQVAGAASSVGWRLRAAVPSPITGPAGNVEFLLHLVPARPADAADPGRTEELLRAVVDEAVEGMSER